MKEHQSIATTTSISKLAPEPDSTQLLHTIFKAIAKISNEQDIERLLARLADLGRDLVSADRCTVWMLDKKNDLLWTRVSHGLDRAEIPSNRGICGYVISSGEAVVICDPYNDSRFEKEFDKVTGYRTKGILALPIKDSDGEIIGVFQAINKMSGTGEFSEEDKERLLLAAVYTGREIEASMLQEELENTQKEIIFTLAETGEMRSKETGYHVRRVAEFSYLLASKYGLPESECELLRHASPLHDIGKIAIPDSILLKPGRLTSEEFYEMKKHAVLGYDMLKHSDRAILGAAAVVAHEHHEKWNGKGYPKGFARDETHIYGRITAVADVFDALACDRCYKKAWAMDRILSLFKEERGNHFDPDLIDIFFDNVESFISISQSYKDQFTG
jgi:HD-GYP domain-containing protein (c-di-GMP phosphodiesterase class II)